jgi:hypothetical protein
MMKQAGVLSVDWSGIRSSSTKAEVKQVFDDLGDPVDYCQGLWASYLDGRPFSSPTRFLVFTDLSTCARNFKSANVHRWASAVRTARPYIVAFVRNRQDQRYADLVDDILQASEYRVSVCSLEPRDLGSLRTYVGRAVFSTDPLAVIEVRHSLDEDRLWLSFGDGRRATLPWEELGLSDLLPSLVPSTAAVSEDHDSIQVLRTDGSVFDIDSAAVRALVDKTAESTLRDASTRSAKELGRLLRERRKAKGRTQIEVSRISGLEQALISKLENGHHRPRFDTLRRYSEALGLTVAKLLSPTPG